MGLRYFPDLALSNKCQPVTVFDDVLKEKVEEMKNIMSYHNGLGISANQCGFFDTMFLMKDSKGEVQVFVNPTVVETDGLVRMKEACLSAPGITLGIERPASVLLQYQDINGETKKIMAEGIEARCILHEMEHLEGKSFLSHVNREARKAALAHVKRHVKTLGNF